MDIHEIVGYLVEILVDFINTIGYLGIFIGMFLESTLVPIPSEVIMIPAGLAAANKDMNLALVIIYGLLGNVAGAAFSYYIAFYLGRPVIFRIGRFFFIKECTIVKIENYFSKHGEISVFTGRLLIGFRHFISLPAGLAKMNIVKFTFYTSLGSAIWTSILAILGYLIGSNQDMVNKYLSLILIMVIIFCSLLIAGYIIINKIKNRPARSR